MLAAVGASVGEQLEVYIDGLGQLLAPLCAVLGRSLWVVVVAIEASVGGAERETGTSPFGNATHKLRLSEKPPAQATQPDRLLCQPLSSAARGPASVGRPFPLLATVHRGHQQRVPKPLTEADSGNPRSAA